MNPRRGFTPRAPQKPAPWQQHPPGWQEKRVRQHAATRLSRRPGFTLVEVLAVVVILGMLAVTLMVGLSGRLGAARSGIAKTQILQIVSALEEYKLHQRRMPTSAEGLDVLAAAPNSPYFLDPAKLVDPWGRKYQYLVPGPDGRDCEVLSYGADGQEGGDGENTDLSSARLGQEPAKGGG